METPMEGKKKKKRGGLCLCFLGQIQPLQKCLWILTNTTVVVTPLTVLEKGKAKTPKNQQGEDIVKFQGTQNKYSPLEKKSKNIGVLTKVVRST